jgi:energy-coupling factor transporter ATP-binding protein EcfA2
MIDFLHIDGERIEIGQGARAHPTFFGIDSINLLLGRNGSGKTRQLTTLAEILTSGTGVGDQGYWAGSNLRGEAIGADARHPPPQLGVAYYSPLPFRRRIAPAKMLVDASTLAVREVETSKFELFRTVAHRLGVETRLVGAVTYRKDLVEKLVTPFLLESTDEMTDTSLELHRRHLSAGRKKLQELLSHQRRAVTESIGIEKEIEVARSKIEAEQRFFSIQLLEYVRFRLQHAGTNLELPAFATLQRLARTPNHRVWVIREFLSKFGIITLSPQSERERVRPRRNFIHDLEPLLGNTVRLLDQIAPSVSIDDEIAFGVEFEIYDGLFTDDLLSKSVIEMRWENLSSGLLALVEQFARLDIAVRKLRARGATSILLLIDEGDAFLHLEWQRRYVKELDVFLTSLKSERGISCLQATLATHSPVIAGDFPSALVRNLDINLQQVRTFGMSVDSLIMRAFDSASIGAHAADKIGRLHRAALTGTLTDADLALIAEIGDDGIRRAILNASEETDADRHQ